MLLTVSVLSLALRTTNFIPFFGFKFNKGLLYTTINYRRIISRWQNCEFLCCGRGYRTEVKEVLVECNCSFKFCCYIKCDQCPEIQQLHYCLWMSHPHMSASTAVQSTSHFYDQSCTTNTALLEKRVTNSAWVKDSWQVHCLITTK